MQLNRQARRERQVSLIAAKYPWRLTEMQLRNFYQNKET